MTNLLPSLGKVKLVSSSLQNVARLAPGLQGPCRIQWDCTPTVRFRPCSSAASRANEKPFPQLQQVEIDRTHVDFVTNYEHNKHLNVQLSKILGVIRAGGGEKAMKKHTELNKKIFVRDRLKLLLDDYENDFLELSPLAGWEMDYGTVPAASNVCGIGRIRGKWCTVSASDATIKGGTSYPVTVTKQLRLQEISQQNTLPSIYVIDSGGAFLPLQSEIFPDKNHGGRVFYNEAVLSAQGIPQVAIVCGSCTAGGAYVPTMADEAVIMHKIGTIFLGGPPLVHAATREIVTSEELGGATLHCKVSGCTDHFAETEEEGFRMGRDTVSTLNITPPSEPQGYDDPLYDQEELLGLVGKSGDVAGNMRKILARLVDGSRFYEFKKLFGPTLLAGFAYMKGHLVGIIANDGALSRDAAVKGSHFAELCQHRNVPLVFLQSVDDDESWAGGDPEMLAEAIKARAKMAAVVACMTVPKVTVMVGSSYGSSSFVMCNSSFDPRFVFMWPNARSAMHHPEELARIHAEESGRPEDEEELRKKYQKQASALYASSRMWNDGVIAPQDTRQVLGKCLSMFSQQASSQQFISQNRAVLRM